MTWVPLPRIAFAIATYPFNPTTRDDLPLQLGDELYIIESCGDGEWFRGYLVAPPSLLAGLTSTKGATLEARVFSGIFPSACVEIKEYLTTEIPQLPEEYRQSVQYDDDFTEGRRTATPNGGGGMDELSEFGERSPSAMSLIHSQKAIKDARRKTNSFRKSIGAASVQRYSQRVRPAAPVPMLKVGDETPSCEGEPLVDEISSCLREWHAASLHELLLAREYPLLDNVYGLVQSLGVARRQLLHGVLTKAELARTREKTVWALVRGNKLLSKEIIVRDPTSGRILTGDDSCVEITALQSQMSLLDAPPVPQPELSTLHHLLLELKAFVGISPDPTTLVFYLSTKGNIPISESFQVELTPQGVPTDVTQLGKIKTLFTDLSPRDTVDDVYLVARIYSVITITPSLAQINTQSYPPEQPKKPMQSPASSPHEHKLKGRISVLFSPKPGGNNKLLQVDDKRILNQKNSISNIAQEPSREKKPLNGISEDYNNNSNTQAGSAVKTISFKKPIGVGVLDIGRFIRQDQGTEQVMRIFVPLGMGGGNQHQSVRANGIDVPHHKHTNSSSNPLDKNAPHGDDWDRLVKDVIESNAARFEKSAKADRIHLFLRPFIATEAEQLIRQNPTILHNITCTPKIGFSGAPTKPRSDFYITVGAPHLPRHALLLHPRAGSVPLPPSQNFNALQITLQIRKASGHTVEDCIIPYANSTPQTYWKSSVVARDESWNETIRIKLKEEDVPLVHVYITVSSVPHNPIALAYFPLWNGSTFVPDGDHNLLFHKLDEITQSPMATSSAGGGGYLQLPWTPGEDNGWASALSMGGAAASLKVQTYLCSTRYSQDEVLLSLLKWKEASSPEMLVTLLKKIVFVSEIELVKLLKDVFDALFSILVDHAGQEEIEDLVFFALVTVLGIVYDRRFHLEPILDEYTDKHFTYPFVTASLLRSFMRLLGSAGDPESAKRLRATFKVGKHIFRFIVAARERQKAKEAQLGISGSNLHNFPRELHSVFKLLENLMRSTAPIHVGSQTLAVQHFHTWLPELTPSLTREQILLIAIDFLDSCSSVKGKLILYKLVLIVNYCKMTLFSDGDSKRALILNTVRWLEPHWGFTEDVSSQYREQVRLCCSVLAVQLEHIGEEIADYLPLIVDSYRCIQATGLHERETFSLLFPKVYPFPFRPISERPVFDEALIELATIIAAASEIPNGINLDLPEHELGIFLTNFLQVHMSILRGDAFPHNWLSIHIYHHKSTLRSLEIIADILMEQFLPDPDDAECFNTDLWHIFFSSLLMLVGSEALALETFPEQKRRAVWKVGGDVREMGASLLRRTWQAIGWETSDEDRRRYGHEKLGGYQVQYVPGLVAPIVELCLSVHEGLRGVAVEVLQTMVVSEWTLSQDLGVIQAEVIDTLDALFKARRFNENIAQKLFVFDLAALFEPLSHLQDDPLHVAVKSFLHTIEEFLELLVAVHNNPLGEAYRIMDTLRLMEFLKDMNKEDMYIRYIHQLVQVQATNKDYVEAGLSLKLHADLYDWDPNHLVDALEEPNFPQQSSFDRKEYLCLQMIKYFEDGKSWENALDTYKELAEQYENYIYDYARLSRAHRAMAKIYENIAAGDRFCLQYFRVAYLGLGFPMGLRDRQFIVQGNHYESLPAFMDRMQQQHPSAKIVASGDVDTVEGQFVHITAVKPEASYSHPVYQRSKIAPNTREFLLMSKPRHFSCSRPTTNTDKVTEMWVEKTIYTANDSFPTVLRRSEIVGISQAMCSPLENAIETVIQRSQELAGLEKKYKDGREHGVGELTMLLAGAVDSTGVLGVLQYREMLNQPPRVEDKGELLQALRTVVLDYAVVLKRCLGLHGRLCTQQGRPLHENLMKVFEKNFASEISALQPPPPPPPISPAGWKSPLYGPETPTTALPRLNTGAHPDRANLATPAPPSTRDDRSSTKPATTARARLSNMLFSTLRVNTSSSSSAAHPNKSQTSVIPEDSATTFPSPLDHPNHNMNGYLQSASTSAINIPRSRASRSNSVSTSGARTTASSKSRSRIHLPRGKSSGSASAGKNGESVQMYEEEDTIEEMRRPSTSSNRPPGSSGSGIAERMGSVKKRFSQLKLGKKVSRVSVRNDGVVLGMGPGGGGEREGWGSVGSRY